MNAGICRTCKEPVIWVKTETGRTMPLDAVPALDGNVEIENDVAKVVSPGDGTYVSHFATCAHAAKHRRPRKESLSE